MAFKIIYSPLAKESFRQNISYLEEDWTIKEIQYFIQKTSDVIDILKIQPVLFPVWEFDKTIRKVVIIKQITLFYEFDKENVYLHLFWNNYQDPEKIKLLLKG
jgi:hypothetical protein